MCILLKYINIALYFSDIADNLIAFDDIILLGNEKYLEVDNGKTFSLVPDNLYNIGGKNYIFSQKSIKRIISQPNLIKFNCNFKFIVLHYMCLLLIDCLHYHKNLTIGKIYFPSMMKFT